ncbi:MAG TPA: hypothetical protein VMV94_19960, partial [Phycisphaerae bacterium]|nr:hypothetical protein [Phycisphaerae bacterium]
MAILSAVALVPVRADGSPPTSPVEEQVASDGCHSSVAMTAEGDFLVAWRGGYYDYGIDDCPATDILVQTFHDDGSALGDVGNLVTQEPSAGTHHFPSAACSRAGAVRVAWWAKGCTIGEYSPVTVLRWTNFDFYDPNSIAPQSVTAGNSDYYPSAAISDAGPGAMSWARLGPGDPNTYSGLVWTFDSINSAASIRECPVECAARLWQWRPCMSMRNSDGYFAVVWQDEEIDWEYPPFNIAIRVYDADGNIVARREGPDLHDPNQWVNDPVAEDPNNPNPGDPNNPYNLYLHTSQESPAVSFVGDDIVVCWIGPELAACEESGVRHIYARRFKFDNLLDPNVPELRDPIPIQNEGRAGMFIVDSAAGYDLLTAQAHPTVSLRMRANEEDRSPCYGCFVVAWNANMQASPQRHEIHAQYFDSTTRPLGTEFRVNRADGEDGYAWLGRSGQHAVVFGEQLQVVATWTESADSEPQGAYFTLLPPNHWESTVSSWPCYQPGDVNGDCHVNGLDIQWFIELLLADDQKCRP